MTVGRVDFTLTLLSNGKVLAAGGADNGTALSSAELYNPASETWTATGSMTGSDEDTGAILLQNDQVFVTWNVNLYNPSTGTWDRHYKRASQRGSVPYARFPNGNVFLASNIWR
jgi:hypothetical protein